MTHANYLLTGGSGFLGSILRDKLAGSNTILTLGRSSANHYAVDLSSEVPVFQHVFETVVHAGGKAHVIPATQEEADDFLAVNLQGTINLTKGLEALPQQPKHIVFISTVAVYGREEGEAIDETHALNGTTPYAQSKIQAEAFLQTWCAKHQIILTILRLPLIVGPNPPGNLGKMIRMMRKGMYVGIGSGIARKSMVLASDIAAFIPRIRTYGGVYNLTDGYHPSMVELENALAAQLGKRKPLRLPDALLKTMARLGDWLGNRSPLNSGVYRKLVSSLTFADAKARTRGWNPNPVLDNLPFPDQPQPTD